MLSEVVVGDVVYVAQWVQEQTSGGGGGGGGSGSSAMFLVEFVDWDGTLLKSVRVRFGSSAVAHFVPVREGYTFVGWNCEFGNVRADLTVIAQYEQMLDPPVDSSSEETWAFVNLVFSVVGVLLVVVGLFMC